MIVGMTGNMMSLSWQRRGHGKRRRRNRRTTASNVHWTADIAGDALEDWQQEDLKGCTGLFRSLLRSPLQLIPLTALIHGSLISVPPSTALHPSKLSRPRTYLTGLTSLAR